MKEKLVRNMIPLLSAEAKDGRSFRVASRQEMPRLLAGKLLEETEEVVTEIATATPTDSDRLVGELVDQLDVIDAIMEHYCITRQTLMTARARKRHIKGGFTGGFVLDLSTNPERFRS